MRGRSGARRSTVSCDGPAATIDPSSAASVLGPSGPRLPQFCIILCFFYIFAAPAIWLSPLKQSALGRPCARRVHPSVEMPGARLFHQSGSLALSSYFGLDLGRSSPRPRRPSIALVVDGFDVLLCILLCMLLCMLLCILLYMLLGMLLCMLLCMLVCILLCMRLCMLLYMLLCIVPVNAIFHAC